jgi:hypothetical protein
VVVRKIIYLNFEAVQTFKNIQSWEKSKHSLTSSLKPMSYRIKLMKLVLLLLETGTWKKQFGEGVSVCIADGPFVPPYLVQECWA